MNPVPPSTIRQGQQPGHGFADFVQDMRVQVDNAMEGLCAKKLSGRETLGSGKRGTAQVRVAEHGAGWCRAVAITHRLCGDPAYSPWLGELPLARIRLWYSAGDPTERAT